AAGGGDEPGAQRGRGRAGGERRHYPFGIGDRARARAAVGASAAEVRRQAGDPVRGRDARHGGRIHQRAAQAAPRVPGLKIGSDTCSWANKFASVTRATRSSRTISIPTTRSGAKSPTG